MGIATRDLVYSIILHVALILMVTMLNPFVAAMRPKFDAVTVNLISLPPLGNPALLRGDNLKASVPQKTVEEKTAVPIATPESKAKTKKTDKKKETAKPARDTKYKGDAAKGEGAEGGKDVTGQLGPGSKFGTVSVDNAGFDYPYYFIQAFGKIQQNWANPVAANQPLTCVIYFQIIRTGTVLDPAIEKSSGVEAYDRACLRAVQSASPLPPLPSDFRDDIIGIHLEFPYQPG
ncbi:MAG: energy transducer TonB [candidate division Zixibacteria bacterium]|nr:energy transducer TonB [candidate division Zixibacteria bacterium]